MVLYVSAKKNLPNMLWGWDDSFDHTDLIWKTNEDSRQLRLHECIVAAESALKWSSS